MVPDDGQVYLHNQRLGRIEFYGDGALAPRFAYQWARSGEFNRQLFLTASGSKILHTSPSRIEAATILLPPVGEQHAIAAVLESLDAKIAVNAEIVKKIDFTSRNLFESSQADSKLLPLSDAADFINGGAFTKGASGDGRIVVRIAELNSGISGSTVYSDAEVDDRHVIRAGDVLFSWSGSLTLNRWYRGEAILNQHIFKVVPKNGYPRWLVFELIRAELEEFRSIAADKATTMGHIQRRHLDKEVSIPARAEVARIHAMMNALQERALRAQQESLKLAELRDTLLPELMSGRLRVKDAEKKIEEVV